MVSGGSALSSIAQNGTDQTKSAGNAKRSRFASLTVLGNDGGPPATKNQSALIGPSGALPVSFGLAIDVGSKPAKELAWPDVSNAARAWQDMQDA